MPAASHSGAIAFGLVHIPVKLYNATSEGGFSLNQLHRESMSRIGYKKIRKDTGEEVKSSDIVKGYEYEKDKYVVLSDEEIEQFKSPKDKAITIDRFIQHGSIDPIFFDKSYYVVPDASSKAFYLLREAMLRQNVVGVATTVLTTKDTVMALTPVEHGMIAQTLFYQAEVKAMPMPAPAGQLEISDGEMNMASMLIQSMVGDFQPDEYQDASEAKMRAAIQAKIEGREVVSPEDTSNIIDLMDALQRSLANRGQQGQTIHGMKYGTMQ